MGAWLPESAPQHRDWQQREMLIKDLWTFSSPCFPFPLILEASLPVGMGNGDFLHLNPLYLLQGPWCHHHCKAQAGFPASHLAPAAVPEKEHQRSEGMSPQHRSQRRGRAAWAALQAQPHEWAQPQTEPPPHTGCNGGDAHTRGTGRNLRDFFNILGKGELLNF